MIPRTPAKLSKGNNCDSIRLSAEGPGYESYVAPGVSQIVTSNLDDFGFTRSVIATSVEILERFCPNSHTFFKRYCDDCAITYIVSIGCHERTCSFCSAQREKKLIWEYNDSCKNMQNPKLITLTAPWFKNPREGKKIMTDAFRRLRQRRPFKYLFKKGIYGFHFLPRPDGMWYIHIHALIDTKYVPQKILSKVWSKCLPGAVVTDIRKAWSPKGGLKYILGYITATRHLVGLESYFNSELKGTRLVSTTGDMHATPVPHGPYICHHCGNALYSHAPKHHIWMKWHNYNRKKTEQQLVDQHEWKQTNSLYNPS